MNNRGVAILVLVAFLLGGITISLKAYSHEMTPTYPVWERAHLAGILKTKMEMFNKRSDVEYYAIGVFDKDWKPVPFVSAYSVVKLKYLGHLVFDVYINEEDKSIVEYICSKSKLRKEAEIRTAVSSRICSKFKE